MRRTLPLKTLLLAVITPVIVLATAGFGYAAYVRLYATILEGFDRKLAALSSATSVFIDTDATLALLEQKPAIEAAGGDPEQHPTYRAHVEPMRRVRERAGLTFLYTQVLKPGQGRQCVYVLDGTVGEGHSKLGEADTVPDDDWDVALRVLHDGAVAQTGIRQWEQWGLLKCGWAPMYGADGSIKAMAGADVEITVIRQKTYVALLQTLGAGALALALASGISVRVARRLTRPLGEVREAALRIASGDYRARCRVERPREMRALARTLNALAQMMEATLDQARPRTEAWRRHRAERALLDHLSLPPCQSDDLAIHVLPGPHASGYVIDGPMALVWRGRQEADELAARRTARDIERVARELQRRHRRSAAPELRRVLGARVASCAAIDRRDGSVQVDGDGLVAWRVDAAAGDDPDWLAVVAPEGTPPLPVEMLRSDVPVILQAMAAHARAGQAGVVAVVRCRTTPGSEGRA